MVSLSLDSPPSLQDGRPPRNGARRAGLLLLLAVVAIGGFAAGRWTAPEGRSPAGSPPAEPVVSANPVPRPSAAQPQADRVPAEGTTAQAVTPPAAPQAPVVPAAAPAPAAAAPVAPAVAGASAPAPAAPAQPTAAASPAGPRRIVVVLQGALEDSIRAAVPAADRDLVDELAQVVNRLLVWNLRVSREGLKGDRLELLYTPPSGGAELGGGEPVVQALRYDSQKLATVIAAYRFQAPGARWHRYYRADGSELEERLVDSPTPEYDQITSLLRDGRRHKGVDFRTPVGTPVHATFDGVIERRNWNWGSNGNCLDVRDPRTGRHAIFLHLDAIPKEMATGRRVKKGERIASSGNTGHSFAPHIHYQLETDGGQVLDPFAVQAVHRLSLDGAARTAFEAERARLDKELAGTTVANAR